jgi:hypothetical protein
MKYINSLIKKFSVSYLYILIFVILLFYLLYLVFESREHAVTAISIIFSTLIIFWGWEHNKKRELKITQRNKRINYLEQCYRQIAMGVQRDPENEKNEKLQIDLEEAVALIQLYGDSDLIELLEKNFPNFDDVLKKLRSSLRRELHLDNIDRDIKPYRTRKEEEAIQRYNSRNQ